MKGHFFLGPPPPPAPIGLDSLEEACQWVCLSGLHPILYYFLLSLEDSLTMNMTNFM